MISHLYTSAQRCVGLTIATACVSTTLALAQGAPSMPPEIGPVSAKDAVMPLMSGGSYDGREGTDIVCGPNQKVGVLIKSRMPVDVRNMTIRGCSVGLMIDEPAPPDADDLDAQASPMPSHRVEGLTISQTAICVMIGGDGRSIGCNTPITGGFFGNIIGECEYGIVNLAGTTQFLNNVITDNTKDGVVLGADCNRFEGNTITNNGRYGVNMVAKVLFLGPNLPVYPWKDHARGNVIRSNVINGNDLADIRTWPTAPCWARANVITNNQTNTVQTGCATDN